MNRTAWLRVLAIGGLLAGAGFAVCGRGGSHGRSSAPEEPVATVEREDRPRSAPPVPTAVAPPPATPAPPPAPLTEADLMDRLRQLQKVDPEQAVALARDGNVRFAGSPDMPERTSILIHALANLGQASEARAEAESMVNDYEDSRWVREVEAFTGAHRHREVRVSPDGAIEFL